MKLQFKNTNVLILGGNGMLGTHLASSLSRMGAKVSIFDRAIPSEQVSSEIRGFKGNFSSGEGLKTALIGIELVYHLISTTTPSSSDSDPIRDIQGNLIGSVNLLNEMRVAGVRRIVFASSGGTIYGNPTSLPVAETHKLQPICSYGIVKSAIEHYITLNSALYGLTGNILRISNPYGMAKSKDGLGAIAAFAKKLLAREPIEIWGDGSVIRDYVYIDDVVRALMSAGLQTNSDTYNIGSGVGHSLKEVLNILQAIAGVDCEVRYSDAREFDVDHIFLDIEKAHQLLGWSPSISLEQGCALYWKSLQKSHLVVPSAYNSMLSNRRKQIFHA